MINPDDLSDEQAQELCKLIMMIKAINCCMQEVCPGVDIKLFCEWAFGGEQSLMPMPDAWNAKHGDKYSVGHDIMLDEDIPKMVRLYKENHE